MVQWLNLNQRKALSQILVDIGKITFTATVVSYFGSFDF